MLLLALITVWALLRKCFPCLPGQPQRVPGRAQKRTKHYSLLIMLLHIVNLLLFFYSACRRAKYELQHLVRVNLAGQDRAYRCVYQLEDENGEGLALILGFS